MVLLHAIPWRRIPAGRTAAPLPSPWITYEQDSLSLNVMLPRIVITSSWRSKWSRELDQVDQL